MTNANDADTNIAHLVKQDDADTNIAHGDLLL